MKKLGVIVLFIGFLTGGMAQSPGFIDSLKHELTRPGISDTIRIKILLELNYYCMGAPLDALIYGREAQKLAKRCGLKEHEAYAYGYIGSCERFLGNHIEGIEAFTESAKLFRNLGMVHQEGFALTSIGTSFIGDKDLRNSIKYFRQGYNLFKAYNDTFYVASTLLNIGEAYRIFGENDSALHYFNSALYHFGILKNHNQQDILQSKALIQGNLGMVHLERGRLDEAKVELSEALLYFRQIDDPYRTSVYQSEMGKLFILEGYMDKGEDLILQSLSMAENENLKEQIRDFSLQLSQFYEAQDQSGRALYFYKHYKAYDDSLKNVENVRKMEQLQSRFELAKKEVEITDLNNINRLQQILAFFLLVGVLFFLVFIFLLIQTNRKVKASNALIREQKRLVEQRENEKALLLRELNHRVKNNLQMVASMLSLNARQLKGYPAADVLIESKFRVEALTLIHQKLYRDDVDTKIDLREYIDELAQNLVMNFDAEFNLSLNLISLVMTVDKAIPLGLVMNELITNSLKYGRSKCSQPQLGIEIREHADLVFIEIRDNGEGLPLDFDLVNSKSFGLKLVHSLVKQLGGAIEWKSNEGTHWTLTLNRFKIC
jgi:two-component sensor histidine kinase